MKSAFGVDHPISKSMLPGGVFKPVTQMSRKELHANAVDVFSRNRARKAGFKPASGTIRRPNSAAGRKIWDEVDSPQGKEIKVRHRRKEYTRAGNGMHALLGSAHPNGRGGGTLTLYGRANDASSTIGHETRVHEMAHLTPKRNPVTASERWSDPVREGREEGRADFLMNHRPTPGNYPGSRDFRRGYKEVQTKMAAANGTLPKKRWWQK